MIVDTTVLMTLDNDNHIAGHGLGSRIGCSAAPVAVGNCGNSPLPVGRQHTPRLPGADTHQRGRLVQCHVLFQ